jgi:pentatricopeptide repeat-containing protein PET309
MKSLAAAGKSASITAVVEALFNDGFLLDNKNWNEYIQILAQNHHFKLAFTLCERNLMDNWQGWAIIRWQRPERNRLSIEERHRKKMPLYLRPNSHTLLYLARAFLDLQEMADESKEARDVFFHVLDYCPKVVNAIKTLQRTDSSLERDILRAA